MESPSNIYWKNVTEIKRNIRRAITKLRQVHQETAQLRNQHISTRDSAINIANKISSEKTILNIQKIKHMDALLFL